MTETSLYIIYDGISCLSHMILVLSISVSIIHVAEAFITWLNKSNNNKR